MHFPSASAVACLLASPVLGLEPTHTTNDTATLVDRQVEVIGTSFVDTSLNGVCRSLQPAGGLAFGTVIWSDLDVDNVLVDYLTRNPPTGANIANFGWTGVFVNNVAAKRKGQIVDCRRPGDNCLVDKNCADFVTPHHALAAIAIENIHRSLAARIFAYDRVIRRYDANNQELVKQLLKDLKFPKTRGFQIGAFLSGFFLGAELALGAVGGVFTAAIKEAVKLGVKEAIKSAVRPEVLERIDLSNDGKPVVDGLRAIQDELKAILFAWNNQGVLDPKLERVSAQETVSFFQGGAFLEPLPSDEEMIQQAEREIFKQTNARLAASLWHGQEIGIHVTDQSLCGDSPAAKANCVTNGCSEIRFLANDFNPPRCLELGKGEDLPGGASNFRSNLEKYDLSFPEISLNAAACALAGGAGTFPPADSDVMEFGFLKCTFPLRRV